MDRHGVVIPTRLIKPGEAARILAVSTVSLQRWTKKGRLSLIRTPGGHRRYLLSEIQDLRKPFES